MKKEYSDYGIKIPFGRTSGKVKTYCPKCHESRHNKTDKSLSVNLDESVWKCHYCGWAGCLENNEYHSVATPKVYQKPTRTGSRTLSPEAVAWFVKERGISIETLSRMQITQAVEYMPQKNGKAGVIQFNYFHDGELVNVKSRTRDKCFKLGTNCELLPYNIDAILGTDECIITEGEMDALSFVEAGRNDVVSVPNGASGANLTYLDNYIEKYFEPKKTLYIASDDDPKGIELRDELVRRFGASKCRLVTYGEGCKDANEHLLKFGAASLLECLDKAHDVKVEGIFTVRDFEASLDALFENGLKQGATIGHYNFDMLCSFETGRLCIVSGIPASGKSEFIDEIAERLNMRYGWRFAYFSPENAPLAYHASKLIEKITGKKFQRSTLPPSEYQMVKEHLETDFNFIMPTDNFRLENILDKAEFLVRRRGIKALVIDPYNRLESDIPNGMSETNYISKILDMMTSFAQRNDILLILMAHPTKMQRDKNGITECPNLYNINGSAAFYNKADYGIIVHRNYEEDFAEVHVDKVKFKHMGRVGIARFKYNINNGRYVPFENNEAITWDNTNHLVEKIKSSTVQLEMSMPYNKIENNYSFDDSSVYEETDECPF